MTQNYSKYTNRILEGKDIRKTLAPQEKLPVGPALTEAPDNFIIKVVNSLRNDSESLKAFAENLYEEGYDTEDLSNEEALDKYGKELVGDLVSFVERQMKEKNVWGAYFPDFNDAPYWYIGFNEKGAVLDSGVGKKAIPWFGWDDSVAKDKVNETGGGDWSSVSAVDVDASIDDILKMRNLIEALGDNYPDNWCCYKGSLAYWVAGDCDDNIPEIGIDSDAKLYCKDFVLSNVTSSNIKEGVEIIEANISDINILSAWPMEIMEDGNADPDEKQVVEKLFNELKEAGFKVEKR